MDKGKILDEQGKHPTGSILNTFSGFFSRDGATSVDTGTPTLTSFKELSNGETLDGDSVRKVEPSVKTSTEKSEDLADADLVQVTRVETHSDEENDEEEATGIGTTRTTGALFEKLGKTSPSEKDNNVEGDEPKIPVFRTHNFRDRSRIEAILYASKFNSRGRSRPAKISTVSKQEDLCNSKESTTTVSVAETSPAEKKLDRKGDEKCEHNGVDCSQPVPSVISEDLSLETPSRTNDEVFPLKLEDNKEKNNDKAQEKHEKSHSIQISSSASSNPTTSKVLSQLASNPAKQTQATSLKLSGSGISTSLLAGRKEPTNDSRTGIGSATKPTAEPKKPETTSAPPVSSAPTSITSSNPSPPKGAQLSAPPSFQMPALFSSLRVLKKGAVEENREIKQREKDADLALLNLKRTVNKAKHFPEQKTTTPVRNLSELRSSTSVEQLSQRLGLGNRDDAKKSNDGQEGETAQDKKGSENGGEVSEEKSPGPETSPADKKTTTDMAYETFKSIFGPKTIRKEKTEEVDLEAVKRKLKSDKENLRLIFERTSKSPIRDPTSSTDPVVCSRSILHHRPTFFLWTICLFMFSHLQTEVASPPDSEDRTPGRLQAVWPPPKSKDEEEKVGLKYTEAGKEFKLVGLNTVVFVCI